MLFHYFLFIGSSALDFVVLLNDRSELIKMYSSLCDFMQNHCNVFPENTKCAIQIDAAEKS